jgi:Fe-S-cluster-containing dehydrogenase component
MKKSAMAKGGDGDMNNRVIRTADGRVYYCAGCPYRNTETETGFCGFCMLKILDEMKQKGDTPQCTSYCPQRMTACSFSAWTAKPPSGTDR